MFVDAENKNKGLTPRSSNRLLSQSEINELMQFDKHRVAKYHNSSVMD